MSTTTITSADVWLAGRCPDVALKLLLANSNWSVTESRRWCCVHVLMQRKMNSPFRQVKTFSAGDFFFPFWNTKGGKSYSAVALRAGSAKRMYNTDPREMINGAIKELMRGILIAAEPINQPSRALEERNEKAGQ